MTSQSAHDQIIRDVLRQTLDVADAREAIFLRVQRAGHVLTVGGRAIDLRAVERIFLIAIGKAAAPMAGALVDLIGDRLSAGVLVTRHDHAGDFQAPDCLRIIEAGHPVPDASSIAGARAIAALLHDAAPRDLVLCAISGGGSALVTLPVEGVSLDDLQATTGLLLRSGATIHELNAVRKHLDGIKGGGLARLARGARTIALLLSDVVGDDLSVIASGLTAPDPSTFADAWRVIERFSLANTLPAPVREHLMAGLRGDVSDTPKPGDPLFEPVSHVIVGSNRLAVEAAERAARSHGLNTLVLSTFVQGEAREVAKVVAAIAREIDAHARPVARPACAIWGGETTVTVRGSGRGGRNQELALAAAFGVAGLPDTWIAALATDGSDGPTDAAGAIVTGETIARARQAGLDAQAYLANNDSHQFFLNLAGPRETFSKRSGEGRDLPGLIVTGPTGTNVNDVLLLFMF